MKNRIVRSGALTALTLALMSTTAARAEETELVVVTGSYITGAAEQAALPVTVLSADDLKKRGSPSMVELIKDLPSSGAVFGVSKEGLPQIRRGPHRAGSSQSRCGAAADQWRNR